MTAKTIETTVRCAECAKRFPLPPVAQCPHCGSRQVRSAAGCCDHERTVETMRELRATHARYHEAHRDLPLDPIETALHFLASSGATEREHYLARCILAAHNRAAEACQRGEMVALFADPITVQPGLVPVVIS